MTRSGPQRRRLLPTSLLGRSLLIVGAPLILLQIVVAVIFYDTHLGNISRRLSANLAGDVGAVIDLLDGSQSLEPVTVLAATRFGMILEITPLPALPAQKVSLLDVNSQAVIDALTQHVGPDVAIDTVTDPERIAIYLSWQDRILKLSTQRKRLFSHTTYLFVIWMVGVSIILFGIAVLFLRNQVRPIRRLAVAADRFGRGDFSPHVKPEGAREVRQATAAFMDMRERIQRHIGERTRMLAGVSHDLRTPLTRMKLQMAMLGDDEAVQELRQDVDDMERMLNGYLDFARGAGDEPMRQVDLASVLRDVADRATIPVTLDLPDRLPARVQRDAVARCLINIMENAARYARHAHVEGRRQGKSLDIVIDDDGPGISETERGNVFRPFYRLEESRNPDTGGIGLGLSIVQDVIHRHGGEVTLERAPMGGLRVKLHLPL